MPNTPNYTWNMPTVGADLDTWGDELNATTILIDAEMFKKADKNNPVFTGVVTAPAFVGNPSAILRPTVDSPSGVTLQNAAGNGIFSLNTLSNAITHAGAVTLFDTHTDNAPILIANKTVGGQARFALQAVANSAALIEYHYGAQEWLAGAGVAEAAMGSFDIQDTTGSYSAIRCRPASFRKQVEIKDRLVIGAETVGVLGALSVQGYTGLADSAANTQTVARFSAAGNGAILFDTINTTNPSGFRRGFYSAYNSDEFGISRYPNNGAGPAVHDVYVNSTGRVGVGTGNPGFHLHVAGPGTATDGTYTPSANLGSTLYISDSAGAGLSGGAIAFGAGGNPMCAIRSVFTDGTSFGAGSLSFYVRTNTAAEVLTAVMTLLKDGRLVLPLLPSVNPGAGTKVMWCDTADGNRVKFGF